MKQKVKRPTQRLGWWLQGVAWGMPKWNKDPSIGWRWRVYRFGAWLNNI